MSTLLAVVIKSPSLVLMREFGDYVDISGLSLWVDYGGVLEIVHFMDLI